MRGPPRDSTLTYEVRKTNPKRERWKTAQGLSSTEIALENNLSACSKEALLHYKSDFQLNAKKLRTIHFFF